MVRAFSGRYLDPEGSFYFLFSSGSLSFYKWFVNVIFLVFRKALMKNSMRRWKVTLFLCLSIVWVASQVWALGGRPHPPSSWIRVAVIQKAPELKIDIRGPYRIVTTQTSEVLDEGRSLTSTVVQPTRTGIVLGSKTYKIFAIRIETDWAKSISVNGKKYRGLVEIFREQDLTLTVVNRVGIEEYIYGVLRHEVAPWWPKEAMKAQALISRTYAAYSRTIRQEEDFDVTGDVLSQVYGGAKGETRRIRKISRQTWGQVLYWQGELFPTYYSSTCGGHTEAAQELWKIDIPPLQGRPCEFCTLSKHYVWDNEIRVDLIHKKMRWRKYDVGTIRDIQVVDHTSSGRVRNLKVIHDKGHTQITAHQFRMMMGPEVVRSTQFTISRKGPSIYLKGKGWGHGVGLCQWGAFAQARRGVKYKEMLSFYYPGATIVQMESKPTKNSLISLRNRVLK
jgi:stage II sporulation protein D